MHKNPAWLAFIGFFALVMLWYGSSALYHSYQYYNLKAHVKAEIQTWSSKEVASEEYAPYAHYTFKVGDKEYKGESSLGFPIYRNPWAVEDELPKIATNEYQVWYNPSDPTQSTLHKKFPTKETVYAIALLCLLLYFVWLGYYVTKKQNTY